MIFFHKLLLFYFDIEVVGDIEAVPLVVDRKNLALDGVTLLVAQFAEEVGIDPPLEGHGVLGEDEVFVFVAEGNPLAVDLYLGTRDVEDNAMIVALLQSDDLALFRGKGLCCRHQVLHEEARRVDQLERLSFWKAIISIVSISISIQIKSNMVCERS